MKTLKNKIQIFITACLFSLSCAFAMAEDEIFETDYADLSLHVSEDEIFGIDDFSSLSVFEDEIFRTSSRYLALHVSSILHKAVTNGNIDEARTFIANNPYLISVTDSDGLTPLHHIAFSGPKEAVEILLEAGADPNALTHENYTPLDFAMVTNNPEEIESLLIASGAIPSQPSFWQRLNRKIISRPFCIIISCFL